MTHSVNMKSKFDVLQNTLQVQTRNVSDFSTTTATSRLLSNSVNDDDDDDEDNDPNWKPPIGSIGCEESDSDCSLYSDVDSDSLSSDSCGDLDASCVNFDALTDNESDDECVHGPRRRRRPPNPFIDDSAEEVSMLNESPLPADCIENQQGGSQAEPVAVAHIVHSTISDNLAESDSTLNIPIDDASTVALNDNFAINHNEQVTSSPLVSSINAVSDVREPEDQRRYNTRQHTSIKQASSSELDDIAKQILRFVIKRGTSCYMTLQYTSLIFLDILLYLAIGTSLDRYQQCFLGGPSQKWHFPYTWLTNEACLKATKLPARKHFDNKMKKTKLSRDEYKICQDLWVEHGCKTMKDFVLAYNRSDIINLPECTARHAEFFRTLGVDLWKDGVSLPSLAMNYMFGTVAEGVNFVVADKKNTTFYWKLRNSMIGGLSIIINREMISGVTAIRPGGKLCQRVVSLDSNNLYTGVLKYDMPTGFFCTYSAPEYKRVRSHQFGFLAVEWMTCYASDFGVSVWHRFNNTTEYTVLGVGVDGFVASTNTVLQLHGCYFHGCKDPECPLLYKMQPNGKRATHNVYNKNSFATLYQNTLRRDAEIRTAGYTLITMSECVWNLERVKPKYQMIIETLFWNAKYHPRGPLTKRWLETAIRNETVFGFVEVTMHTPQHLKEKFAEFQPFFKKCEVSRDFIGDHMKKFAEANDLLKTPRKCLLLSYFIERSLLLTSLVSWYLRQGLVLTEIHTFYSFKPVKCFQTFVDTVTSARRAGDNDENKKILAEMFKCVGNSSVGKTLIQRERHKDVRIVDAECATKLINDAKFDSLDEISSQVFEVTSRKKYVKHNMPLVCGITVYNYAKREVLKFIFEFLYKFFAQQDVCLLNHDTDSLWLGISAAQLDDIVKPELRREYFETYDQWLPAVSCEDHKGEYIERRVRGLPWDMSRHPCCVKNNKFHQRTPLLFKFEFIGSYFYGLNSKTFFSGVFDDEPSCVKYSTKGISKKHSNITKEHFISVLKTQKSVPGVNRSFISKASQIYTYTQERTGLSYLYYKRPVGLGGKRTYPTEL